MAKQMKKYGPGGTSNVDNSNTDTTKGQRLVINKNTPTTSTNFKKGGSVAATKKRK